MISRDSPAILQLTQPDVPPLWIAIVSLWHSGHIDRSSQPRHWANLLIISAKLRATVSSVKIVIVQPRNMGGENSPAIQRSNRCTPQCSQFWRANTYWKLNSFDRRSTPQSESATGGDDHRSVDWGNFNGFANAIANKSFCTLDDFNYHCGNRDTRSLALRDEMVSIRGGAICGGVFTLLKAIRKCLNERTVNVTQPANWMGVFGCRHQWRCYYSGKLQLHCVRIRTIMVFLLVELAFE